MFFDPLILTIAGVVTAAVWAVLAVVREANSRADRLENDVGRVVSAKMAVVDAELIGLIAEIIGKRHVAHKGKYKASKLPITISDEERDGVLFLASTTADLQKIKENISEIGDRTTEAYVWGVACGFMVLLTVITFFFFDANPYYALPGYFAAITAYFYFRGGVWQLRKIRSYEKCVRRLDTLKDIDEIGEELHEAVHGDGD